MSPVKQAPEEVRRWVEEQLFGSVPVSIAVVDRAYGVVLANPRFEEVFGAWRGRRCWEVYKSRDARCERCPAERVFADGEVRVRREVGRDRHGEEAHYLVQVAPVRRPDGTIPYCIEISTDITALHELEREKAEAERLAAVGQTVAGLAHGIKNVITGLEGGMYVMRTGLTKGRRDRVDSGWEMLERNVERISLMAKNLLAFSKERTPEVRRLDPREIVRDVVALYRDAAAQVGIDVRTNGGKPVEPAPLDAQEIHACVSNLVSNAIDACRLSERRPGNVEIRVLDEHGTLVFEVEDNGVGIDVEVKRKIFTTFFTTKGSSGTGLGLLLVRKVAQEHGGTVEMTSEVGRGSRFRILLPRSRLPRPGGEAGGTEDADGQA